MLSPNSFDEMFTDLNERLQQPPKPKLIVQKPAVDVAALQRTVSELEHAKSNYVQQISQLNDVITSLRREVAASQAKLSDVTGRWIAFRNICVVK